MNGWRFEPVLDKDGESLLYDIYDPSGRWHGSQRTQAMCAHYVEQFTTFDERQAAQAAAMEEHRVEAQAKKNERVEKELAASSIEYDAILECLKEVCQDNPDKEKEAREKPKAQGWFVGQIRKRGSYTPVMIQKVVADYFQTEGTNT